MLTDQQIAEVLAARVLRRPVRANWNPLESHPDAVELVRTMRERGWTFKLHRYGWWTPCSWYALFHRCADGGLESGGWCSECWTRAVAIAALQAVEPGWQNL